MQPRRLESLSAAERAALLDRDQGLAAVREDVGAIVERVREQGDEAATHHCHGLGDGDEQVHSRHVRAPVPKDVRMNLYTGGRIPRR